MKNPLSGATKKFKRLANLEKENKFPQNSPAHFKWTLPLAELMESINVEGSLENMTHKGGYRSTAGQLPEGSIKFTLPCIGLYCLVLPYIALYCIVLPCIALYCLVFPVSSNGTQYIALPCIETPCRDSSNAAWCISTVSKV